MLRRSYPIEVTNNAQQYSTDGFAFEFTAEPIVTAIAPTHGTSRESV